MSGSGRGRGGIGVTAAVCDRDRTQHTNTLPRLTPLQLLGLSTLLHQHWAAPTKGLVKPKKCQIPGCAAPLGTPVLFPTIPCTQNSAAEHVLQDTDTLCISWYGTCHAETQSEQPLVQSQALPNHSPENNCAEQTTGNSSDLFFFFKSSVGNFKIFKFWFPSSSLELHQEKELKSHIIFLYFIYK